VADAPTPLIVHCELETPLARVMTDISRRTAMASTATD
jgi:hypothetical protein